MTIIEIRPYGNGWQVYEAPGSARVLKPGTSDILRRRPHVLPYQRDSDSQFTRPKSRPVAELREMDTRAKEF